MWREELTSDAVQVRDTKNIDVAAKWRSRGTDGKLTLSDESWESDGAGDEGAEDDSAEGGSHIGGCLKDLEMYWRVEDCVG